MKVRWGELAGAILTFFVLVVFPFVALNLMPIQILDQLSAAGLDVQSLATGIALLGLIISSIAIAKAFLNRTSLFYLALDISSNIVSLVFTLLVVGVGDIGTLGYSNFKLIQGNLTTEIVLDLRIFIYLTLLIVALSIMQSIAKFREARIETKSKQQLN